MNKDIGQITRQLIAKSKTEEALKLLLEMSKNKPEFQDYNDNLIVISARYNNVKKNSRRGIISNSELTFETNKITYSLLEIVKEITQTVNNRNVNLEGNNQIIVGERNNGINIKENFESQDGKTKDLLENMSSIKILFIAANSQDTSRLRVDEEMRDVEKELERAKYRDRFQLIKNTATRISDLQTALLNHVPNIIHFCGHGTEEGIKLQDSRSEMSQVVDSVSLAKLFKLFSNDIACVFLNSCYSEKQGEIISKFIPNVIGMRNTVADDTALEFSKTFYMGLGAGRDIGFSFELAKNSIDLNGLGDAEIPVLLQDGI